MVVAGAWWHTALFGHLGTPQLDILGRYLFNQLGFYFGGFRTLVWKEKLIKVHFLSYFVASCNQIFFSRGHPSRGTLTLFPLLSPSILLFEN